MTTENPFLKEYLATTKTEERIAILQRFRENRIWLPIALAEDLLCLDLDPREASGIIRAADHSDKIALEDIVTRNVRAWHQDVASLALREWAERTDTLLWHRTLPLSRDPALPQRVSYTLLDLAWNGGGDEIIQGFSEIDGLEGMSPAFIALMFHRAMQFGVKSERLLAIAKAHLEPLSRVAYPDDKTVPYALAYILRFAPDVKPASGLNSAGIWGDVMDSMTHDVFTEARLARLDKELDRAQGRKKPKLKLDGLWPRLWQRHELPAALVAKALRYATTQPLFAAQDFGEPLWHFFAGVGSATLVEALATSEDDATYTTGLSLLGNLITATSRSVVLDTLRERIGRAEDPAAVLAAVPQSYRIELNGSSQAGSFFERIFNERQIFRARKSQHPDQAERMMTIKPADEQSSPASIEAAERRLFVNLATRGVKPGAFKPQTYFGKLAAAWEKPEERALEELSQLARQAPHLYQFFYINALGRFRGMDRAALKLLDYIRSSEEDTLRAVIRALGGISTTRAYQEMIAFLTRPNISFAVQMEITQLLHEADLSSLQAELRSAIADLKVEPDTETAKWELRESLQSLLQVKIEATEAPTRLVEDRSGQENMPTTGELEQLLISRIPEYNRLSSETKRALRTAQFFHIQVASAGNLHTIDLSPAIDMQYKALELTFRETFEDVCGQLIRRGVLQRKLDVIGYARPIPQAMDEFEKYIEGLPIISSIPFFSRFKLRKMLRAICQFRPGRRFTLDGLKAFALFFICFGRKECRYGLENLFPLPGISDRELAEFCKALHVFQDFRNRAAHEGFHPDASNDIDGIWNDTASIIANMFRLAHALSLDAPAQPAKRNDHRPVIVHKQVS